MPSLPKRKAAQRVELWESSHNLIKSYASGKKKNLAKTTAASLFANGDIADHYSDVSKT